jgi:type II secretory pathway pseudopilin PulG
MRHTPPTTRPGRSAEDGFLLLGAIVAIAIILIALAIAAPIVARDLRRQKELEAMHRGNQYIRAVQLYYRKFGRYPGSIEQLEHTNNIRFLRQRYADPMTGKDDWTTIPVGQNKTTVKTFFGQPIAGIGTSPGGTGSVAGMLSSGIGAQGSSTSSGFGSSSTSAAGGTTSPLSAGFSGASAGGGATDPGSAAGGTGGTSGTGAGTTTATGASGTSGGGVGSQSATSFSGGGGAPFVGVRPGAKGDSIITNNEQTTYQSWEFIYDPRLDALKAKALALNGGLGSTPANSLGNNVTGAPGSTTNGTGAGTTTGAPASGGTGTGGAGTTAPTGGASSPFSQP